MLLAGLFLIFLVQFSGALDADLLNKTDYFVIQNQVGYDTLKWLDDWINIKDAKGFHDIMNQTQQSQQTAQKLLPNYTPTVQSAWTQLQDLGRSVVNGTINNTDVPQQARQIYASLGRMNNGQSMGMGMQGNGRGMMNNPNQNGQGGMMNHWNSGRDYNDENE
uniref:DUF148 domain-containing protein n=1 Tax=Panagrolaimus sp. JU765 TaxID=591449 RepID=A0AC34RI00_9BILA